MAKTLAADMIVPEVLADMISQEWPSLVRFLPMAVVDTKLEGNPGDTIEYPVWELIGEAIDLLETDLIVPTKLTTSRDAPLTIKEAGKGVEITDKAMLTGLGNPMAQARTQLSAAIAHKIDTDLFTRMGSAGPDLFTIAAQLTVATAPRAFAEFNVFPGEMGEASDEFAAWVVDSFCYAKLLMDPAFLTRDKAGPNATLFTGAVGTLYGVPVVVSNKVSTAVGGGPMLIRKGLLVLAYKRRPLMETDRDILARSTVFTGNVHYGTIRAPRRGVVRFAPSTAPA